MKKVLWSIISKEFIHIRRDKQTLAIVILWPLLMLFLYGYAITLEMKEIPTIITDLAHNPLSREYVDDIASSRFFRVTGRDIAESEIEPVFRHRRARCVIVIPPSFGKDDPGNRIIQLIIDASDPNAANYIHTYLGTITASFNRRHSGGMRLPFRFEPRLLYNPDLKSSFFFVPGLVAVIIMLFSALLSSIAIVREKEMGTLEQILVSPLTPMQLVIGKLVPYLLLSLADSILVLIVAHVCFTVPMHGSGILLLATLIIYVVSGLSFGLLISTVTRSQQIAMMATMVITVLPSFLLSGFIFPVRSMPLLFQGISQIIPATHFLIIIRGIMLKGAGLAELMPQLGALTLFSLVLISVSIRKFHTTLE
ncbi:ABC transporter permease [bacterium]|nr:ABC transporter permease [bacterium]